MKKTGLITTLIAIILSVTVIFFQIITGHNFHWIDGTLILFLITIIWMGQRLDRKASEYQVTVKEKENLVRHIDSLTRKVEEFEQFFNSFDGVTLFMYDVIQQKSRFSKGVESLFGLTQNQFITNGELWKGIIHPDDREKVAESEALLHSGNAVQVDFRIIHPTEGEKWVTKVSKPITNDRGMITQINGQFMDITTQKELENELRYMAYFDDLTDLPNRKMLDRHVKKALARSKRHHHSFSLMFVDLDDFKQVNDTLGHDAGDQLLVDVVERLGHCTREEDLIARIGGDEFIVVFEETTKKEIEEIAKRIIQSATKPYILGENEARISVSIGVSMYPDDGDDKETLIKNADKAMYFAKNNGKNNYKLYSPDLQEVEVNEEGIFAKWISIFQKSMFSGK
ncbi:PAS domain S-box-containing protein/diguanylate cyclase (GGDEF) domain-containing protein [Gracilibacillus ureilyticus]|uniref:PAS domain S-box-containing protein/diguanylate cyclase (GGDEF) domain-containing protein n=1 Tax=Gracilibacillus ureilyticus TaxID=531814 RepID=A0A1H9M5U2_9BACI|nr:sensor domain-containing diguanylate cyclase [Gracilibacillus ureilyticus]SER18921.1 PAS domain S-box-containing protein/diguanylate cyclase (GGDEF) domain-containing protein [Gracilibacillus ureilyticus]